MRHFAETKVIPSPKTLHSTIREFQPNVILLDMNFQTDINTGNEGLFYLSEIKQIQPDIEVVLFTAYGDIALAVEGMKRGAFDFVIKPWDNNKLVQVLIAAGEKRKKMTKNSPSRLSPNSPASSPKMHWGSSPAMTTIRKQLEKVATTDASILITGENGTGKDVLANEIHCLSARANRPMVCVDAGAITETLFESELFGHVKGAFTDAHADHVGKFEQANGGTLFLDEIGNIPLHLQGKLLRVLQNRAIVRVGDTKEIPIDIRLICATNRDIPQMVQDGTFREDLYYRINTMHLQLPPLRQRQDEILPLAERFMQTYAERYHRNVNALAPEAQQALLANTWSGNIRELNNCIEKAVILSEGDTLTLADLQLPLPSNTPYPIGGTPSNSQYPTADSEAVETLEAVEERAIRNAMAQHDGNLSLVAKALNISRPTLYAKLKKYGI
jgi:DNA-binding NtrC family response regulator